jgi:D-psicose/D-tagatose/L-ribulose 3-epimerase
MTNPIGVISMFYARPFTRDHFPALARIKRAGADCIEMLVPEEGELDLGEARAAIADAGLSVVLAARVNLTRDLASSDPDAHDAGVAYLQSSVRIAEALGSTLVGGPLYGAPMVFAGRAPTPCTPEERKRRIYAVAAGLSEAGRVAHEAGVRLAVEPLNRFETDIANTARHACQLAELSGSPAVGVMLDTFHMDMEESDLARAIRQTGDRLFHFQANENHRGFVGSGHIDWPPIARALVDIGYVGPIVLEPFRRDDEDAGVTLAQWRAPARDEDAELTASIDYLKATMAFARRAA